MWKAWVWPPSLLLFWINVAACVDHCGTKMELLAIRIITAVVVALCLTSALPQVTLFLPQSITLIFSICSGSLKTGLSAYIFTHLPSCLAFTH